MLNELTKTFETKTRALEFFYLLKGLKPALRLGLYPDEINRVDEFCRKNNLFITFSDFKVLVADNDKDYSNKGIKVPLSDRRIGMVFAYISIDRRKAVHAKFFEANNNHQRLGEILGYPACCVDFFIKNEPEMSKLDNDYVLPIANNSKGDKFTFYNNILKRYFDITLLSHFPCSFNCRKSEMIAKNNLEAIWRDNPELAEYIEEKLKGKYKIGERVIEFV